jgi:hypothetical protein
MFSSSILIPRRCLSILCIGIVHAIAAASAGQDGASTADQAKGPAYPLVVRIDQRALESMAAQKIDQRDKIDMTVLGTHTVGNSRTRGAISVESIPDQDDASFDLVLRGSTRARTTGTNGPALIYSHADTNFVCERPITFDASKGFVAGASKVTSKTKLTYDGFGSSRGVLGRQLISRVAEKRAGGVKNEAERIAARTNERGVLAAFDKAVNAQLASMNKKLNIALYKNMFLGEGNPVQLAARSSEECIHIGIGHEGDPAQLTEIPPRRETTAPFEIWIHLSNPAEPVGKLVNLQKDTGLLPEALAHEIRQILLVPNSESGKFIDLAVQDGWIVLGLRSETLEVAQTAKRRHAMSHTPKPVAGQ